MFEKNKYKISKRQGRGLKRGGGGGTGEKESEGGKEGMGILLCFGVIGGAAGMYDEVPFGSAE